MVLVTHGDFSIYGGDLVNLTISSGTTPSCAINDIDVSGANSVAIQVTNGILQEDGTYLEGSSTKVTVYVFGSNGIGYTSDPINTVDIGSNKSAMIFATLGYHFMSVKILNTDASNATVIKYKIFVKG